MNQEGEPQEVTSPGGWNRLSLTLMGAGLAAFVGAAELVVLVLTGILDDGNGHSVPETVTGFGYLDASVYTPKPTPTLAPEATPPSGAPIDRLLIPKYDVDAPIVTRGIVDGVMEAPDGPAEVAWYDFSAHPGFGSNAVFSGHVDWHTGELGVFWHLSDLEEGDRVLVRLTDGTEYEYSVSAKQQVPADENVSEIVGATDSEFVTLITCGGTFSSTTGQYDQRLIVRAERVYTDAPAADASSAS